MDGGTASLGVSDLHKLNARDKQESVWLSVITSPAAMHLPMASPTPNSHRSKSSERIIVDS